MSTATIDEAPRAARVLASFLIARAAFGAAYLAVALGRLPVPWYFPLERRWAFAPRQGSLAMAWYGSTATALLAAIAAGAIAWLASSRGPFARYLAQKSAVPAIARAVLLVLIVDFATFGWLLTHQTPEPRTIPAGCAP